MLTEIMRLFRLLRHLPLAWPVLLVAACAPVAEDVTVKTPPLAAAVRAEPVAPVLLSPRVTKTEHVGIHFEGVAFDTRSHRLKVVDQVGGPSSIHAVAASAAQANMGLAAVNGGFFTPAGEPLGRVIASGNRAGTWNSASSLGSGLWHADAAGKSAISRRESIGRAASETMHELLQAGPMLVENTRAVGGLDAEKTSARTMILWDGGTRWWIGRSSPATLAAVASALTDSGVAGWRVRHALNLDGGRSSELWVSSDLSGGPLARRPAWNRPVRNFLVLVEVR
jgi:hypothetical protein